MTRCPSLDDLERMLEGQLDGDDEERIAIHVNACSVCQHTLDELTSEAVSWAVAAPSVATAHKTGHNPRSQFLDRLKTGPVSLGGRPVFAGSGTLPTVPGYETLRELGRGGIGVVYLARQKSLNRLVALKVLRSGPYANAQERERFRAEAEAVARLRHPNIVHVYEVGDHDGIPFLALEYVEGGSLGDRLRGDPQPLMDAAALVEILAHAIHAAHEAGIIHRDLKPANILIQAPPPGPGKFIGTESDLRECDPRITDFGLAKRLDDPTQRTATGDIVGTPSYMAPEQASLGRGKLGPATDVYALGAILYELLTGRPPFKGTTAVDTIVHLLHEEPVRPTSLVPELPRDLETICLTCLNKDSSRRYASADALAEDLARFRRGQPIQARPVGLTERAAKWARRHPLPAALLLGIILIGTLGFLGVTWQWRKAIDARDRVLDEKHQKELEREEAERARAETVVQRRQAETALYGSRIAQSQLSWRVNDLVGARLTLEGYVPLAGQEDHRGWEWFHLQRLYRSGLFTLEHSQGGLGGAVAHSPRGDVLASVLAAPDEDGEGELRIWEARTGWLLLRRTIPGSCHRLAFHADGATLAVAGTDGTVRILDVLTGAEHLRWTAHEEDITELAYSPDGKTLVTASWDKTVRLWSATDGKPGPVLKGHLRRVQSVSFHPDGKTLATASWDGSVRLWPLAGGPSRELAGHKAPVFGVAFSPDGKHLASGAQDGNVKIWEAESGRTIQTFTGLTGAVLNLVFSPDGRYLAYGGGDGTARVWDFQAGTQEANFRGHTGPVEGLSFSADAQTLVSCCPREGVVIAWDMTRNPESSVFAQTRADVEALAFDAPGRRLVTLTVQGRLQHWDRATGLLQAEYPLLGASSNANRTVVGAISPAATLAALAEPDTGGNVRIRDAATGRPLLTFSVAGQPTALTFSPDDRQLAVGVSGEGGHFLTLRDTTTGKERRRVVLPGRASALAFRGAEWLAWGSTRGEAGVLHWPSGRSAPVSPHRGAVLALAFSHDGEMLASAGEYDRVVRLSRLVIPGEGQAPACVALRQLETPAGVCGLVFSPDGKRLAGITRDVVKLWDHESRLEMLTLRGSPQRYWDAPFSPRVVFSPDGAGLAGTNWNESVSLWEAEDAGSVESAGALRRQARRLADERAAFWHLQEAEQCLRFQNQSAARFHLKRLGDAPLSPPLQDRREAARKQLVGTPEE